MKESIVYTREESVLKSSLLFADFYAEGIWGALSSVDFVCIKHFCWKSAFLLVVIINQTAGFVKIVK